MIFRSNRARMRPRRTAALSLAAVLSLVVTAPVADAAASNDHLHHRQSQVQSQISRTSSNLDEVSHQLVKATRALDRAKAKLVTAKYELAQARGALTAAEALDAQLRSELAHAKNKLSGVRRQLHIGARKVARQRDEVAALAVEQFQGRSPQLLGLGALLNAGSPHQLSNEMAAVGNVLDQGAASLSRLKASRVLLDVQAQRVATAKQAVADRRAEAARNLVLTQAAEDRAAAAKRDVAALVSSRQAARSAARQAVRAERDRLAALRGERQRIGDLLAARARRQLARHSGATYSGPSTGYLDFPVDGPITSPYGMRMHPILHIMELHDGTDFGVACGTPIHAAADGVVLESYFNAGYGNRLIVADGFVHGVSLSTSYNHLFRSKVSVGDHVKRGEVIAFVGSTGYSTGCHLHFMVYENGRTVDPLSWF